MKPLFPTLNVPSIKPQVLGLVVDADHEISTNDGTIYVQLHPTDDEMYAEVHFNFEMDYKFIPAEYMDGYLMCGGDVQLGKHNITSWEVATVEGTDWTASVDDKVMIKLIIDKWIDDRSLPWLLDFLAVYRNPICLNLQ